jgi:hypothetical protein
LDEAGILRIALETERLARDAEAVLDLGTDRNPPHATPDRPQHKIIPFVSAVEADFLAVETGADPELEGERLGRVGKVLWVSTRVHDSPTG